MSETVPLTPEAVQAYLDGVIRKWRAEKKASAMNGHQYAASYAECYIDAYQSVRSSLLGETLPKEE